MSRTFHHHHRRMRWNGPNWWHHLMTERPNRRKAHLLEHDVRRAPSELDAARDWPHPHRIHIYFY